MDTIENLKEYDIQDNNKEQGHELNSQNKEKEHEIINENKEEIVIKGKGRGRGQGRGGLIGSKYLINSGSLIYHVPYNMFHLSLVLIDNFI